MAPLGGLTLQLADASSVLVWNRRPSPSPTQGGRPKAFDRADGAPFLAAEEALTTLGFELPGH